MLFPEYIMLHHSGTLDSDTLSWGIIRRNHIAIGYDDIGYHFGIEYVRLGYEILAGRMPNIKGAHCRAQQMNHQALSICFIGNFDKAPPTKAQWDKGLELVGYLMGQFLIPDTHIIGHRDVADTNCPGRFFDLGKFRGEL